MVLTTEDVDVFKLFGERAGVEIHRQAMETSLKAREATLWAVSEGTAQAVGEAFFHSLVKNLATALKVQYAFVSEFCVDRAKGTDIGLLDRGSFQGKFRLCPC